MDTNLFVGNLTPDVTATDLRAVFSRAGTVLRVRVAIDRATGQSRGYGFVEMADGAEAAIQALNGTQVQGRALTVRVATAAGL